MAELLSDPPASVLAVYAHPDDAEISCGATLARWALAGTVVNLVICALGDKGSTEPETDSAGLVQRRQLEVDAAAGVLGLGGVTQLGRRDGELENDLPLRGELVELIRRLRPEAIVCPDPTAVFFGEHYYNHRDHRVVGWAALDAASPAASSPLYFPDAGPVHAVGSIFLSGSLEANVFVDVAETIGVKAEAVMRHESQLGSDPGWLRGVVAERAEDAGVEAGVRYAEAFRRIRLLR